MIESLSIAVHAFVSRVSMSFSVDETLWKVRVKSYLYVHERDEMRYFWMVSGVEFLRIFKWRPIIRYRQPRNFLI